MCRGLGPRAVWVPRWVTCVSPCGSDKVGHFVVPTLKGFSWTLGIPSPESFLAGHHLCVEAQQTTQKQSKPRGFHEVQGDPPKRAT